MNLNKKRGLVDESQYLNERLGKIMGWHFAESLLATSTHSHKHGYFNLSKKKKI